MTPYDVLWTCIIVGGFLGSLLALSIADDVRRRGIDDRLRRRGRRMR